jgi:3-dehydroquinate synthase
MTSSTSTVRVDLGDRSYDIAIGSGILQGSGQQLCSWKNVTDAAQLRCLLVTDRNVRHRHAAQVEASLNSIGAGLKVVTVPAGEESKSLDQVSLPYDELVSFAADRRTVVIAVGGGVVGDLAGFVAATYARGLPFVQVPTTLLAQVDSSVGGKTGVNHAKGKNLIGAFHQPLGVLIDIATLTTLPDRDYRSGLAEVIKYGVILDEEFFAYLENNISGLNDRDPGVLQKIVSRSCELKAMVVKEDEYETTGLRAILNYGHTFAHAFEALAGYGTLMHGEAVSIGMVCASRLAEKTGRITADDTGRQVDLLTSVGLPVEVPGDLKSMSDEIVQRMLLDKKTVGGKLRFILPDRIGHVELVDGVDGDLALSCL